ncbi:MAG: hypothetical protein Q9159_002319 [Coniocarpon cinnabarinum]
MSRHRPSTSDVGADNAAPDISIVGDQVTLYPSGYSESATGSQHETHDREVVEHAPRFRKDPLSFLRELSLHVQGSGWRSYDKVVGQPVFYNGFSENMKNAVLSSPMLRSKIQELAEKRVVEESNLGLFGQPAEDALRYSRRRDQRKEGIEASLNQVCDNMTDDMICKMESKPFIRFAYYFVTQLLTRAYHQGIHVSSEEVLQLRSVAEEAAKKNQSIIFLPCHRSHVDYVSLQLICYRLGLVLPTVVAGDNLNFPVVGPFLQHAGAMWIRRSFGEDHLYQTLVQAYIDTLLQKGFNFECFIEGGRSRMGKLLPPKFGILSFLLDSLLSGRVDDAIICPVSTQYDKVIEVDSYISELLGQPKPKENLADFLSTSSVLSLRLGRVDVRFHQPWSLRGFINEQQSRFDALSLHQQRDLDKAYDSNLRLRLLRTLGYRVLAEINEVSVVMPTSLIGTVLLTLRGRGVGKSELVQRVEWLSERVRSQGGRVAHFAGLPTTVVVERGLEVLGPKLVGVQTDLAEETYFAVDRFQLSFYRNMTIHLFINEALVSAAMYTAIKAGSNTDTGATTYEDLITQVSFLSQLFRGEFIFPTEGLETNLQKTLAGLERDNILAITRSTTEHAADSNDSSESKIISVSLSNAERSAGRNNFDFHCFLIWPFIEAAWLGAISLLMLTPPASSSAPQSPTSSPPPSPWLDSKAFQTASQHLGKTLFAQGDLSYFEAVNKETLKNAYVRFEEEEILQFKKPAKDGKGPPEMIRLMPDWTPRRDSNSVLMASGRLWEFAEEISKSRLEGKNRRDGEAVVERVLRLVGTVSEALWKTAGVDETHGGEKTRGRLEVEDARRTERRRRAPLRTRANL